jgi:anti-sigma B factor antagonist
MPIQFKAPARFDATQVAYMRTEIERLATATDHVVVDLARTEELDGSGIGAMVYAFKRLEARGLRLSIRSASGQPLNLLHTSGLLRTLSAEARAAEIRDSRWSKTLRSFGLGRFIASARPRNVPVAMVDTAAAHATGERAKGAA